MLRAQRHIRKITYRLHGMNKNILLSGGECMQITVIEIDESF